MKISLFVPCYIDAFFPDVGVATLELLGGSAARSGIPSIKPVAEGDGQQQRQYNAAGAEAHFVPRAASIMASVRLCALESKIRSLKIDKNHFKTAGSL